MKDITFDIYTLQDDIRKALSYLNYIHPTTIQEASIPMIQKGADIFLLANTGSGKTASFAIPLLDKLDWNNPKIQCVVIVPTRELALQVQQEMFAIARFKRLKIEAIFGGSSMESQRRRLKQRVHALVATPGRLLDHLIQATIDLQNCEFLVFDEADEILELGFQKQIEQLLVFVEKRKQTMMLSATLNDKVEAMLALYMEHPQIIDKRMHDLKLAVEYIQTSNKQESLLHYLSAKKMKQALIFLNTKKEVETLYAQIKHYSPHIAMFHGDLDQKTRTSLLKKFKRHEISYMIATNVIARGIDIDDLDCVMHYEVPLHSETFLHRSGRTARQGNEGTTCLLVSEAEYPLLKRFKQESKYLFTQVQQRDIRGEMGEIQAFLSRDVDVLHAEAKQQVFEEEITTLYIQAGKKDKLRAGDVVGSICALADVVMQDIGIIEILEHYSFVEILNHKGNMVWMQLQTHPIKAKIRKVEIRNKNEM
ncbi:MAG: DEAD/DEAH box helicase [Breznakia sp.]